MNGKSYTKKKNYSLNSRAVLSPNIDSETSSIMGDKNEFIFLYKDKRINC